MRPANKEHGVLICFDLLGCKPTLNRSGRLTDPVRLRVTGWHAPSGWPGSVTGSTFDQPPQQRCVVTLAFTAASWAGAVGHIEIAGSASGLIPVTDSYADHTVDLSFAPFPGYPVEVFAFLRAGLHQVVFRSITLRAERVVVDPTRI